MWWGKEKLAAKIFEFKKKAYNESIQQKKEMSKCKHQG